VDKETALAGVDVFPTLLTATGASAPKGYVSDGENMLPALKGQPQTRTKPVFWWWQGGHGGDDWPAFAMREGPWVLILDETKQKVELHNVVADRAQAKNLAGEQPERVARMTAEIEKWFATLPKTVDPALQSKESRSAAAKAAPAKKAAPTSDAAMSASRAQAFPRWDKNNDGILTLEEYRNGLAKKDDAEKRFKGFDTNGDGKLTREEFVGSSR
jgi:arylsulfatase A-like enzyme